MGLLLGWHYALFPPIDRGILEGKPQRFESLACCDIDLSSKDCNRDPNHCATMTTLPMLPQGRGNLASPKPVHVLLDPHPKRPARLTDVFLIALLQVMRYITPVAVQSTSFPNGQTMQDGVSQARSYSQVGS
ncbi:unnamed protein product [Heligmosomoides polygyrus]|uniref:Secreted protein n=1 Tax=Heligmosomoides polygyrus TaxID=6339 RepID=A0A183GD26_HELPZ|nr:unnamed protein product [Heligmosomoides polygyrus]